MARMDERAPWAVMRVGQGADQGIGGIAILICLFLMGMTQMGGF